MFTMVLVGVVVGVAKEGGNQLCRDKTVVCQRAEKSAINRRQQ